MECDGYQSADPRPKPNIISAGRTILPKTTPRSNYPSGVVLSDLDPCNSLNLTTRLFDPKEQPYFQYFRDVTVPELSGYFESGFWGMLMLQECHHEPAVRKAVIAIAGLSKTKEQAQTLLEGTPSKHELVKAEIHHQFALQEYGNAIRLMRERLTTGKQDIRRALVWSLLIYCFETYHGDHETALHHAMTGLKLFTEWLESCVRNTSPLPGLKSPAPDIVEDELIQAFSRLDCEVMTGVDRRSKLTHHRMKSMGEDDLRTMPVTFLTLREARMYWDMIETRTMHYFFSAYERGEGLRQAHEPHIIFMSPERIPIEQLDENKCLEEDIMRWLAAFQPLFESIATLPGKRKELMGATILYANAKSRLIGLDVHIAPRREMAYDDHNGTYRDLVSLITTGISSWERENPHFTHSSRFSSDIGIVLNLFRITMKCRDPVIRRDALSLLKRCRCREGIWDSELCFKAAEWVMKVEERGITESGHVPKEWRVCVTSMNCLISHVDQMSATGPKPGTLEIRMADVHCTGNIFAHRGVGDGCE